MKALLKFDEYAKKLKELNKNTPEIFEDVAKKGAKYFRGEAIRLTNKEKKVDTGNYKRNWNAKSGQILPETYAIEASNNVEYASHIEQGYTIKKDYFLPFEAGSKGKKTWKGLKGTPKTKEFINSVREKYPEAKGIMIKAKRVKGVFIGRRALSRTRAFCLDLLDKTLKEAYKK